MPVNPDLLVAIAAGALSLLVAYVPGLKQKYEALTKEEKARAMAALLIGVTLAIYGLACADLIALFGLDVACTPASAVELFQLLITALVVNQAVFSLFVHPYKTAPRQNPG
jgi:hypothetical protein